MVLINAMDSSSSMAREPGRFVSDCISDQHYHCVSTHCCDPKIGHYDWPHQKGLELKKQEELEVLHKVSHKFLLSNLSNNLLEFYKLFLKNL